MRLTMMALAQGMLAALLLGGMALDAMAQEDAKSVLELANRTFRDGRDKAKPEGERKRLLEEAIANYEKIGRQWPGALSERAKAEFAKAKVQRRLGRVDDALASLERCLAIEGQAKSHAKACQQMAAIHGKAKRYDDVAKTWERLLVLCAEEDAACAKARLRLASLARKGKRWDEADRQASKVWQDYPTQWRACVDACNGRIQTLIKRREWVKAIASLDDFDEKLRQRFQETEVWDKVRKAMTKMSSRKTLTPVGEKRG